MFHLYLPVLSQNKVFLSVSHECLKISTSFLFPSVVFFLAFNSGPVKHT